MSTLRPVARLGRSVILLVAVATACGLNSTSSVLAAAGEKTGTASSFHVTGTLTTYWTADPSHVVNTATTDGTVDEAHHAADITTTTKQAEDLPGGSATPQRAIIIGADTWSQLTLFPMNAPAGKTWMHLTRAGSAADPLSDPSGWLARLQTARAVERVGREQVRGVATVHYRARTRPAPGANASPFDAASIDVWVGDDGMTRRLRFGTAIKAMPDATPPTPAETSVFTAEFYDFGLSVSIQAPPPDEVWELPVAPDCQPATKQAVCQSSTATTTTPVALPKANGPVSTLQLRPVVAAGPPGCKSASGTNPPPDQPAQLPSADGATCYQLGTSGLTVTKATAKALTDPETGQLVVDLVLSPVDSPGLDRVAAANFQKQVAAVMFGKVLSAPTINAMSFGGRARLTGVTPQDAANAIASLDR